MQLVGLVLAASLAVPPDREVENNNQPYHGGQPIIRRFERQADDEARQRSWEAYVRELDDLWTDYRAAGSTPRAWQKYKAAAGEAKRVYVYRDRYLAAILP